MRNTKSKTLNPKQIPNTKSQIGRNGFVFGILYLFWILSLGFCALSASGFAMDDGSSVELFRIEIENSRDGLISVSHDGGASKEAVGRVIYPCARTNSRGYTASKWAKTGRVAATAVNAIHIKTGTNTREGRGVIFSIVPKEALDLPGNYNSYVSPNSSIYTAIQGGTSIFGGGYSPIVGNRVLFARAGSAESEVEEGYVPQLGDRMIILVERPLKYPREIIFENRFGGAVSVDYTGSQDIVIAEVLKPVQGIGRFGGGLYSSTGRIRANHTGVIDISTSPKGKVGGFQIIPSDHGMSPEMGNARLMTQWMVVGSTSIKGKPLEGLTPLFSSYLRPVYSPLNIDSDTIAQDLLERFIVQVKYTGKSRWEPMPRLWLDSDMSKPLPKWANSALKNVSHIRILFPVD